MRGEDSQYGFGGEERNCALEESKEEPRVHEGTRLLKWGTAWWISTMTHPRTQSGVTLLQRRRTQDSRTDSVPGAIRPRRKANPRAESGVTVLQNGAGWGCVEWECG